MLRSPTEKLRIILSRVLMGGIGVLVLFSRSAWEHSLVSAFLFAAGCLLVAVGMVGRGWAAGYIAGRKTSSLVVQGPYSLCRNPLYFFSLLGATGVALATETLTIPALFLLPFAIYYPRVIRSEECRLREVHGAEFDAYCRSTPAFWPNLQGLREEDTHVVNGPFFRRNIVDTMWFLWLVGILEIVKHLHKLDVLPTFVTLY